MSRLGIMQGRLLPPQGERFQSFPTDQWDREFALAAQVPVSYIEWIYDLPGEAVNPLLYATDSMQAVMRDTGVAIRSLCADYFMEKPVFGCPAAELMERRQVLERLIRAAGSVGMKRMVLPFVDSSRMRSNHDENEVIAVLHDTLPGARTAGIELHLETDLEPLEFARLLERVPDPLVKVNYDSGNSASLGYAPVDEFAAYGERIGSVHIKDRVRGGGTVPLGAGDADFIALFDGLERIGYTGDITMQVARSMPGEEVEWARVNRNFIARRWPLE